MLKYFKTESPYDCFACNACVNICGHDAIHMIQDYEGFKYPSLDSAKCINCGLCERVCPIEHSNRTKNTVGNSYAAQNIDADILKKSSSGGLFYLIAKHILDNGGVAYGVKFNKENKTLHTRIDKIEDIYPLMGSKYVQSDTNTTYVQVREDLRNGRLVYYTGTPCQISGLKLFLMKDYENLLTSDLICHGTPSQKLFANTIKHLEEKNKGKVINYSFRDKAISGWSISSSSIIKTSKKLKYLKYSRDMEAYFKAFSLGALMRWACYKCPFSTTHRVGDITLADFWGVKEKLPDMPNISRGISLTLVNTSKGAKILQSLDSKLNLVSIPMEWATETNANLVHPTPQPDIRNKAYTLAFENYDEFLNLFSEKDETKKRIKREIETFIRSHDCIFDMVSKILKVLKK